MTKKPRSNHNKLRALSIAQPWAHCIVAKGKNVENRSWNTKYRGYFALHASASKSSERFQYCADDYRIHLDPNKLPYGAIVGFAKLSNVVTAKTLTGKTKKWFDGDYGFVLTNIIRLRKPVRVKGSLSFWSVKGAAKKAALDQLTPAQRSKVLEHPLG